MDSVGSVAILYMNAFTPPTTLVFADDVMVTSSSLVLVSSSDDVEEEEDDDDDEDVSLDAFMTVVDFPADDAASTEENTAVSSAPAKRERNMMVKFGDDMTMVFFVQKFSLFSAF